VNEKPAGGVAMRNVHQRGWLTRDFRAPLPGGDPEKPRGVTLDWKLAQSSEGGPPAAPSRASLVLDEPVVDRMNGGNRQNLLRAKHIEFHGRLAEGSVASNPVIEIAAQLEHASAPEVHPAAAKPMDVNIIGVLRGLK